jgi:hypothetical protein
MADSTAHGDETEREFRLSGTRVGEAGSNARLQPEVEEPNFFIFIGRNPLKRFDSKK